MDFSLFPEESEKETSRRWREFKHLFSLPEGYTCFCLSSGEAKNNPVDPVDPVKVLNSTSNLIELCMSCTLLVKEPEMSLTTIGFSVELGVLITKEGNYLPVNELLNYQTSSRFNTDAGEEVELIKESNDPEMQYVEISNDIVDRALNEFAKTGNLEAVFGENV